MIICVLALLLCVVLSAFFSASEMAVSSANRLRLENSAEDGDRRAKKALAALEHYDNTLSAILLGNNLVNIAASSLTSVIAITLAAKLGQSEDLFTTLGTILLTLIILIFGETAPKIAAKKNATRFTLRFAALLRALERILRPLVRLSVGAAHGLTKPLKGEAANDTETAVLQLQSMIETAEDEDVLDEDESELLQAALDFAEISAGEVMTPRVDMTAIDVEDSPEEILRLAEQTPYSRLPVYEGDPDNIIGVLHLNAYYRAILENDRADVRSLLTEPCWIYKTVKLPAVLEQLRKRQTHLAIVTDEYGGTDGVVSMEDVLERLVGDIWDENDRIEPEVVETAEGTEIDGDMAIGDFLEYLDLREDEFNFDSETVGGWTMEMFGGFPAPGDSFSYHGFSIEVKAVGDKRVDTVILRAD